MRADILDLSKDRPYRLVTGDSLSILRELPDESIDCVITSPPYWGLRDYDIESDFSGAALGMENSFEEYLNKLLPIFAEVKRVLKSKGSLWLNIGDRYRNKDLLGMPWRVAFALKDNQGWILRSDIIWNKVRMTQSAKDRVRNVHEYIFHFVKNRSYFFDYSKIYLKHNERPVRLEDGRTISITGTSGVKYRRQIIHSEHLSEEEKKEALKVLDKTIEEMNKGEILDFRMTIRGYQRPAHGASARLSGRATELEKKGFYIIKQKSEGYLPTDIWDIVPEDTHRTDTHCSVYPLDLLTIPIKATCPEGGIVMDPFSGTGSTVLASLMLGRYAIGIDMSKYYTKVAEYRIRKSLGLISGVWSSTA